MKRNNEYIAVVAGGTGNVGSFVVRDLLERGVAVVVPSRSEQKARGLREYVAHHDGAGERLHTFIGNVSDERGGKELLERITQDIGPPDAVISLMGSFRAAEAVLEASVDDLDHVLEHYLKAHLGTARTFLPSLSEGGGTYVFINGPLAFEIWPGSALVSIATAAQHMLFRALAKEHDDQPVRIAELVSHAYIRNRTTQPESAIPGEAVGAFAAYLVSNASGDIHGQSIHVHSLEQLEEVGLKGTDLDQV